MAELQLWEESREQWRRSLLVVAILVLNLGDIITTEMSMARGGVEINPVSGWLIAQGILAPTKIALVAFIAVAAAAASSRRRLSTRLAMVAGFYVAVVAGNGLQLLLH
ncbi:MAG: DUF5658 family protein [Acidimicrobiales bacterium]|nr:DUF5658 family protein [Actinomycetota bacterium]